MQRTSVGIAIGLLLGLGLAGCGAPQTADWPQYRGSGRDGSASGATVPISWPEGAPPILWQREAGSAFSQIVVQAGAAFTGSSDGENETVLRLDPDTGSEVWSRAIGPLFADQFGAGPRSTPVLDGETLYMLGGNGALVALAVEDGSERWRVELTEVFGAPLPRFGFSGSPLVVDALLYVEVGGSEAGSAFAALDKATGETRWTAIDGGAGYSSPVVAELGGERQLLLMHGTTLYGMALDGRTLWTHPLSGGAIAMPLDLGDGRVFVSSSGDDGCWMLQVERDADGQYSVSELWANREMRNHFNSSVVYDGHIYGFDNATLKCLSAGTGEVRWAHRGLGKGSLALAAGHLFIVGDKGTVVAAEASPQEFRQRWTVEALEGKSWTAPSIADGKLFLRNLESMACIDLNG